ncbi:MAG: hypothetical protein GX142_06685 [Chloroflexi bacterium]|nr:hypothetical protein [Chloroflexota bacterium]
MTSVQVIIVAIGGGCGLRPTQICLFRGKIIHFQVHAFVLQRSLFGLTIDQQNFALGDTAEATLTFTEQLEDFQSCD